MTSKKTQESLKEASHKVMITKAVELKAHEHFSQHLFDGFLMPSSSNWYSNFYLIVIRCCVHVVSVLIAVEISFGIFLV